ncbi:hypothetical protein BV923_20560 [Pectobacterium odoriferum]|nr:hypothetical protein KS43_13225 [Pectobacterium odoriferum]POD90978.1 hypothetical protein BV925_14865 [Pectobacterium odoriferum]POE01961.1 hypothetical protein BVY05_09045 [Pectobacterium odoriferum]POE18595.1 hypothetical protein BV923_20560 [Pectobacterium odoriferum]
MATAFVNYKGTGDLKCDELIQAISDNSLCRYRAHKFFQPGIKPHQFLAKIAKNEEYVPKEALHLMTHSGLVNKAFMPVRHRIVSPRVSL